MENIKRIPYGISNFVDVMEQNQYYVDKTMFLPLLEQQPSNLFLIRPRRFGKSLFLSMLRAYYDINRKDKFQSLFGSLWIGQHPTGNQGRYQILFFDFSRASAGMGSLAENFNNYCSAYLDLFASTYASYYPAGFEESLKSQPDAAHKLNYLTMQAQLTDNHLYLIIDEYDNFTNVVLNEQGKEVYRALTYAKGFYRDAFKLYKGTFERIFMAGVSPVTPDDLTGGFNIGWNISIDPEFNMMLEFSEKVNHGFCDMFLMPDLQRYPEVKHSYILELKNLSAKDSNEKAKIQWTEAMEQVHHYAEGAKVQQMCQGTELHCIIMQFKGWELMRMEEV